ncbi:complement factor H-related protein 1-like isoform X3 [Etheostoma cragini]|uniref:complement factor H-related protein 1-like isoform X3 n=1 Tax=Etheostoma cragini TaxID=417921 RepID=UPI00155E9A2E|nr:complement factor H-related protein 1-like isoform X3 [Etheostoma cragini]
MCLRYLGFAFLVSIPGLLHGHSCDAPILDDGYLVPKKTTYSHEANLMYGCDNGRKPAVEGWWATIICQNGTWSHTPQCIDEQACIPLDIPNGKYKKSPKGWYDNKQSIYIKCDKGYESKNRDATAICSNGTWTSVPVCEKSIETCGEPPKIPHAVIIHQEYQELFAADSEVQYECEDGYSVEGGGTKDSITCMSGNWTEGSTCRARPGPVNGGSAGGGTGGRPTTSTGSGTSHIVEVKNCGQRPVVSNGDIVGDNKMFLKYQCAAWYKRVGPERVMCYSNGMWSEVPICKATFCSVDTDTYPALLSVGVQIIKDGETGKLRCVDQDHWLTDHYSAVRCTNGKVNLSRCCGAIEWLFC